MSILPMSMSCSDLAGQHKSFFNDAGNLTECMHRVSINHLLANHFHGAESQASFCLTKEKGANSGYFRFGANAVCFGKCSSGTPSADAHLSLHDTESHIKLSQESVHLPFDPAEVIDNLRFERYISSALGGRSSARIVRRLYYLLRPFLSVAVRKRFQRWHFRGWEKRPFPNWPVDSTVEEIAEKLIELELAVTGSDRLPFIWFWPDGHPSCTMLTHDVETTAGRNFCSELMDVNDSFGIKSSFHIIPEERYTVHAKFLDEIRVREFELNVHDLNHDGRLFSNRAEFLRRAVRIKHYAKAFGASGFRSAVLYRNAEWIDDLGFSYDMSIPNVAHLDPQRGGCCTVFPFFLGETLELPVTTIQDYSLFHILGDYSIGVWKNQSNLIRAKHGLVSFIIHPDYVINKSARATYTKLLEYLCSTREKQETWIARPAEVATWWRQRAELRLIVSDGQFRIVGEGSERARIGFASLVDGKISYQIGKSKDSN
ncbi:MAG: hypothetical protein JO076_16275 [Verrucomicrobia bacterium]|nr:hypothetical protein [Verrucomicrobiota bacterium]